jgi:hypothetical protein
MAFRDPMIIVMLLVPFLPAAVLSIIAQNYENRYYKIIEQAGRDKKG